MRDFHLPGRSPVYSTHGMAASAMPAATLTALDILRAGGNAMDAAVAAVAVLGVIEPQSTGIGGDCFCLYAPGAVSAWEALLARHGTKGLDELLQPAIRFAEEGWPVGSRVASDWERLEGKLRKNGADAFLPNGAAPRPGDLFVQKPLAETLRTIAKQGSRGFYEGAVAAGMVAALRAHGGLQTEQDFANGRTVAEFVTPIRA